MARTLRQERPHRHHANSRIRYVPNELAAVRRFGVWLLIVIGQAPTADLAHNFVRTLARIELMLDAQAPPFILKVYRPSPTSAASGSAAGGRVERWFPAP